jgi:hypothetical protein
MVWIAEVTYLVHCALPYAFGNPGNYWEWVS